jgi:phage I-like protein
MAWFKRADGSLAPVEDKKDGLDDVEFKPEKLREDIVNSVDEKFTAFAKSQSEAMKPMQEMAELMKAERQERLDAEKRRKDVATAEAKGDFSERMMLDPESAINDKLSGTNNAILLLASREARRETLGDKEYYYGDIKSKVDSLIDTLPLNQRSNAGSLENCYKLVMYDHQKEVAEGKIKARNTSGIFEGGSTGAHSGNDVKDGPENLGAEEKEMAKRFGMSEKDWASSKKELSYV